MAHSVRSHSPVPEIRLDLKNGATVECHKNSVFRIHADILVVSREGSVESGARQKFGWQEWDKRKRKETPKIIHDWKFIKISTSDCQSNFHFSIVYVVAVPVYNGKKWLEEYQHMIKKLLTHAESDRKTSITIPLLGTNAGGAPKEGCVLRVMDAVFEFKKFKSLRKINLVVQGWPEVTQVQDLMAEQSGQTSDRDKYKNINQNKRKPYLISSSKNCDTTNGGSRSPDNMKPAIGNRYNSLSDQNSHSNGNAARGDNPDVCHRSDSSNSRTDGASSSNSRPEPTSDSLTSQKSRPCSARDGREIQNNQGFGIKESSAPRDDDIAGAEGSSVDPAPKNHSAQHGNHSEYQRKGERREDRGQEDALIRKGEFKHPNNNTLYSDKESYAKVAMKNCNMESDHKHFSNRDYTRSNSKDEEFSPEYAAYHKKNQVDSDNKNYSKERLHNGSSSINYHHEKNAEFDNARLQELKETEDQDNRIIPRNEMVASSINKEELESRRQIENFEIKKSSSNHHVRDMESLRMGATEERALREVSSHKCSHCGYNITSRVTLPCCHVYCDGCVPGDKGCPQCEDEKFKKENRNKPSNRGQSSSQQTNAEDPENRSIQRNKMVSSNKKEELEIRRQNGNFDSKKSISNHHVRDMESEKIGASERTALIDVNLYTGKCSYCEHDATSRIRLPCSHVYCILCAPGVQVCPQCEDGYYLSNRAQSSSQQTHEEDLTQSVKKYHCKSCLGETFNELKEMPCHHLAQLTNKEEENGTDRGNRTSSSKEQTHGEDRGKYHCKSCLSYTFSKLFQLPCQHFCCFNCFYISQIYKNPKNCQQCKAEQSNKQEENSPEASKRDQMSREGTHVEERARISVEYYCKNCSDYTLSELGELPCHHFCCFICYANPQRCQQCKAERCNKDEAVGTEPGNTVPSSMERTHGEGRDNTLEETCQRCDSSLANNSPTPDQSCNEELKSKDERPSKETHGDDPSNRVQSSSQQTNGEGQDNTMEDKCQRCYSSLTNNSPVQQACGHTFCARCSAKDCNIPSCNQRLEGDRDQRPSNGSHGDDPSNRVQSSSQRTNGESQDTLKCSAKDCNHPSCNKELKGDKDQRPSNDSSCNKAEAQSLSELSPQDVKAKTALSTCYKCSVNLANNSPVQLACGHTFCAKCASKGCKDPSCVEEPDYDCDDINLNESRSNKDLSHNHGNRRHDTSEPNDIRDTRIDNHSRTRDQNGSDGNHRDRHSSRDQNGSDGNHRDRHSTRDQNGSDGNHRDYHSSRDRNGSDSNHRDRHSSRDRNGSDGNHRDYHSSRDRNGSDSNHRVRHSSRDRNGSDGYHREYHSSRDRNGSDSYHRDRLGSRDRNSSHGNHRDRHRSRNRNGSDGNHIDRHRSRDRNGSDGNHSDRHRSRDRNGSNGNHIKRENEGEDSGGRPKHGEDNLPPKNAEKTEMCAICMDHITDLKKLDKCGHEFCRECIDDCFKLHKPVCPSCGTMYGVTIGNMPPGTMDVRKSPAPIEGFKQKHGSYSINYHFNNGIQGSEHPNRGVWFNGTTRTAYLPASPKGIEVCKMLKVAFKRRLTFTIGRSTTTGRENVVTWNDIHHKTSMIGGPTQFGYPDHMYLTRVKEELASKGVTLADINGVSDGNEFITVP